MFAKIVELFRRRPDGDWFEISVTPHERTLEDNGRLDSLDTEWERELAALWRLEADVNNGAYLQFLGNWGYESYVYAIQGLKNIGAKRMLRIVDKCQALVDEHIDAKNAPQERLQNLCPANIVREDGELVAREGPFLPDSVLEEIECLSYEFMDYPDDVERLGLRYYARFLSGN